ncbi:LLM class flavin-dependent oxidoreductase [Rhizobium rhizogenes]|uniref:LLM class flavin-dependent oxidoreductase n=2 Tax=Rhizobium rhizogenes TaxID=359 RepID=UPI001572C42A|nr:LLM class flavin-dependent oxidoreductase [Rhizobium rhizogenes]NTH23329.1 LLM class flavin-dependent oxidoreductase [Rhizobium rhizogenes]NTH36351.1 LLM class flavin-dependent oxidoreductase [Rhizobium rhizogenes]
MSTADRLEFSDCCSPNKGMIAMILVTLLNAPSNTWRYEHGRACGDMDLDYLTHCAQEAERGKFHAVFLADSLGIKDDGLDLQGTRKNGNAVSFEPMTALSAIAVKTSNIGLIGTVSMTYSEPFNVARQIASLDHISGGRAGWNAITSGTTAEAQNFNLQAQLSSEQRYSRAREHMDVVLRLWDSWDDDAFPRNKESGLYFDPEKAHRLNHSGEHFQVRGPLNLPRSVQGRPLVCQAGASDAGYEMAARWADIMYVKTPTIDIGKSFYNDIKGRLEKYGRRREELSLLPGLSVVVGETEEEANKKLGRVLASLEPEEALGYLSQKMGGYDLSGLELDAPIPADPEIDKAAARNRIYFERNGRRLTLREAMQSVVTMIGHLTLVGSPRQVADEMIRWVEEGAADGFALMPYYLPGGLTDFVDHVVPELQRRGFFHHDYAGKTLRENLGLARPESVFAAPAPSAA